MKTKKRGVVLRVRRLAGFDYAYYRVEGIPMSLCRHRFERLTKIRLKAGEKCKVRVTRVK